MFFIDNNQESNCFFGDLINPIITAKNSRAGISDRYQDLAIAARSLANKFDAKWVPLLFKDYGIENIDYSKLEFYKLLDEFF